MLEMMLDFNNLSPYTVYLGIILGLTLKMIWDWNIESPSITFDRTSSEACFRFVNQPNTNKSDNRCFLIVWLTRCIRRKENCNDDEDGHIYFPYYLINTK